MNTLVSLFHKYECQKLASSLELLPYLKASQSKFKMNNIFYD